MLSQSPGIYFLLSGVLAAIISGIMLIINNLWTNSINNNNQLEREKQQRTWQLEREEQQRIWQEKTEQKKWYREKIYDSYKTSFQVLIKIQQEELDSINKTNDIIKKYTHITNINKLILEFNIEFTMIIANHPDKNSEEFIDKLTTIDKCLRAATIDKSLEEDSSRVRLIMIEIMENDSRIKM
ncbi:hypothetical protein [Microcoleus sp. Z1_B5]|uniref:hypothetical protein n=1 Tax=Microcoleus sp. Z1_B5 TaxID=3055430 RepID=UPI002FD3073A